MAELRDTGKLKLDLGDTVAELSEEDLLIESAQIPGYEALSDNNVTVALDTNLTPELIEEGFVREIVSKIQTMRKDSGFEVMDNINIYCSGNDKIADIMERNADSIKSETLAVNIIFGSETHFSKNWNINGEDVVLGVEKINK